MELHLGSIELAFLVLIVSTALVYVARRWRIADPILLVIGGVVLGFTLEGLGIAPSLELDPDLVFLLFLPPILFAAAYFTPIRDLRANLQPILLLAIGLVIFTTVVVGLVAIALIPGIPPAAAFTLGAIVAPPDAVAATAVLQRLGVPRKVVTILEGESLLNDATSLIAYRVAVAAAATGAFSLVGATTDFVVAGVGGIVVGLVVGKIVTSTMSRTADPTLEIIISFIAPVAAYLPAEELGLSGVLATVVAGLITGRRGSRVLSPQARLLGVGSWSVLIFMINAFVFMAVGLQLPSILRDLSEYDASTLLGLGLAISLAAIIARIVWVFPATILPRLMATRGAGAAPLPPMRAVFVVSWAGMRGVVSLAAALALPLDFPDRDLILFLTFCVIVATLVGQGLTLPWVIARLGVRSTGEGDGEEAAARLAALDAALRRLDDLAIDFPDHLELIDQLRSRYGHDASHIWPEGEVPDESEQELLDHRAIRSAVLLAQREAVLSLRDGGVINDETLRTVERDLDLEAVRSGV